MSISARHADNDNHNPNPTYPTAYTNRTKPTVLTRTGTVSLCSLRPPIDVAY